MVIHKKSRKIICTAFANGKRHDFRLFKESKTHLHPQIKVITDTGYQGLQKQHKNTNIPKKKSNQKLSSDRVINENIIEVIKRFKIIADRYRNRRRRFTLRFVLIAAIYNFDCEDDYARNLLYAKALIGKLA